VTFTADSQLVDRVLVAEAYDRQDAPILAVVVHFAEGGGTDTWLTRVDGNSSHYVIKYDGSLVQLVPESKAAGSMNPRLTRTTNDAAFTFGGETIRYGRAVLDEVLGKYAPIYVNRAVIAIEIEGFARDGLNPAQTITLVSLIKDIRNRRGRIGLLGHRDQQDYKACPGKKIPWALLGGHGLPATTESFDVKFIMAGEPGKLLQVPTGTDLFGLDGVRVTEVADPDGAELPFLGYADGRSDQYVVKAITGRVYTGGRSFPTWLVARVGTLIDAPSPEPEVPVVSATVTVDGKTFGPVNIP
jgi:hypothetical protein